MPKITSQQYHYYGIPIEYRFENRKVGKSIIIVFRAKGKVLFEKIYVVRESWQCDSADSVLEHILPKFFCSLFNQHRKTPIIPEELDCNFPLALVWLRDKDQLALDQGWSKATQYDYDLTIQKLLGDFGHMPLSQLIPAECFPIFSRFAETRHRRCVQLLKLLCRQEVLSKRLESNPWEKYEPQLFRAHHTPNSDIKKKVETSMLTSGQVQAIVDKAISNMNSASAPLYFGSLLFVVQALPIEEICALNYQDFQPLNDFSRMTIHIQNHLIKRGKNYYLMPHEDPDCIRTLPCSQVVSSAFHLLEESRGANHNSPVLPDPRNAKRHMSPHKFLTFFCEAFSDILTDDTCRPQKVLRKIQLTSERNLNKCGYSIEEYRYYLGLAPVTTIGGHYLDFADEVQLNRTGAKLDRLYWCGDLSNNVLISSRFEKRYDYLTWTSNPGCKLTLDVELSIPLPHGTIPSTGLCFLVSVPRGMSISINLNEGGINHV